MLNLTWRRTFSSGVQGHGLTPHPLLRGSGRGSRLVGRRGRAGRQAGRQASRRRARLRITLVLLQVDRDRLEHHPELVRAVGVGLGHESTARHTVCVVLELDGHVLKLGAALVDPRDATHVPGVVGRAELARELLGDRANFLEV